MWCITVTPRPTSLCSGFVTISEGKVKGKDPDAHMSESERDLLGAGKIVVINRRRSEYRKSNKGEIQSQSSENTGKGRNREIQ